MKVFVVRVLLRKHISFLWLTNSKCDRLSSNILYLSITFVLHSLSFTRLFNINFMKFVQFRIDLLLLFVWSIALGDLFS